MEKQTPLVIRVNWPTQVLMILFALPCMLGGLACLYLVITRGLFGYLAGFAILALCAYFGFGNALSNIQVTSESVTVNVFYGRFRILWSEVEKVIFNKPYIALAGNGKRIVLSILFAGKNTGRLLAIIQNQVVERGLQYDERPDPQFRLSHLNARVWN